MYLSLDLYFYYQAGIKMITKKYVVSFLDKLSILFNTLKLIFEYTLKFNLDGGIFFINPLNHQFNITRY